MVAVTAVVGAVKRPLELIEPAPADHVTAELKDPVPWTVAAHCDVALGATEAGLQDTDTELTADEEGACTVIEAAPDLAGF